MNYCINNHVAGIGWPVKGDVLSLADYERQAKSEHGNRAASIKFANEPESGDYIWVRDKEGCYYLGCIKGDWFYSNDPIHLELDIPNQRACEWVKIGNEDNIPGKIVACFRPAKTFQAIRDSVMEDFSTWAFDVVPFWFTLLRVSKYLKFKFSSSLPIIFSFEGSWIQIV